MSFSSNIPDRLIGYPNVSAFMDVLDELQNFKTEIIADSLRVDNAAILMDRNWIIKKLGDYGVTDIPLSYPIQILRQYLLNVDTVCGTRGSKIGVELYCSLLTLGEVNVDDSKFYAESSLLLLDSTTNGYIVEDSKDNFFYLADDNSQMNKESYLTITIKSKFFNDINSSDSVLIRSFLESTIKRNLGFSNCSVAFNYSGRNEYYFHKLLNQYFI